jgi:dihydrofolate reductase
VVAQVNAVICRPSTSGLHHDFHDNLYILLMGRKTFRLFSPDCAPDLHTHGRIAYIHHNGRINYENERTRPDGATESAVRALNAAQALDKLSCVKEVISHTLK